MRKWCNSAFVFTICDIPFFVEGMKNALGVLPLHGSEEIF
jgi:hypothetical protein